MPDCFDEFWTIAPRKRGKGAARKAYAKALTLATEDEIIAGARRWRKESIGKDPSYICHPATWLNQERWEDEADEVVRPDENEVWRNKASTIWLMRRMHHYPRQDIEECHRRGFLNDDQFEELMR